jgi:hypothetical protein
MLLPFCGAAAKLMTGDSLLRFPDHSQLDTDTLCRAHSDVIDCRYVEITKHYKLRQRKNLATLN